MNTDIYYFSGTGNSFAVARDIGRKINGKLISIPSVMDKEIIQTDADVIGIVFPVYYLVNDGIPLLIKRFVSKLDNIRCKYIFTVCTCGGGSGMAIENLAKLIKKRGGNLAGGFTVVMPSNVSFATAAKQQKKLDNWSKRLEFICEYVNNQKEGRFETINILLNLIFKPLGPAIKPIVISKMEKLTNSFGLPFEELILLTDKSYHVDEKCNGCGICSRICPVGNILIDDNKPSWQHHCESCMACFHWCPKEAIQGGLAPSLKRYHHPDVQISDILSGVNT